MTEFKPIRTRRGKVVHLTDDYREAICGQSVDGGVLAVDEGCDCRRCLRVIR